MNSETLISVVLACYNQGQFLQKSLGSLLAQSYQNWECLIINDGSADDTESIALAYEKKDGRFKYFSQQNQGVASARNFGIEKCKGQFVQFLDADDYLHYEKFSFQMSLLRLHENVDVVYGSSRYFVDGAPDILYPLHYNGGIPCDLTYLDGYQVEMILKHNICANCAALFRRKVVERVKFRNEVYEDWIYNLECALNGFVFHFDSSFSSYSYIRITSSSQMIKHTNQVAAIEKFESKMFRLVKEYGYRLDQAIVAVPLNGWSISAKRLVRQLTPPILYSFAARLKRK